MAGNLAEEQKYKVGWAYLHNDGNFAFQNSYVCENLGGEHKALTTATNEAKTRMNRGFARGGGSNFKPHKAFTAHEVCSYIWNTAQEVQSTPISSSRNGLRAEARARSARVDAETETVSFRWRRNGAVYREQPSTTGANRNFRLAGSQTKIRHKLKDLCENI